MRMPEASSSMASRHERTRTRTQREGAENAEINRCSGHELLLAFQFLGLLGAARRASDPSSLLSGMFPDDLADATAAGCAECPTGKDTVDDSGSWWFLATWAEAANRWAHHFFAQTPSSHRHGAPSPPPGPGDGVRRAQRRGRWLLREVPVRGTTGPCGPPHWEGRPLGYPRRRAAAVPPNHPLPVASGRGLGSPAEGEVANGASD